MDAKLPEISEAHIELVKVIGQGSMSTVYLARDSRLSVDRAVKVLAPHLLKSEQARTRLKIEAQTMAGLNHPNVVSVLHVDLDAESPYLVMEFMSGGSLRERLTRGGPVSPRVTCAAFAKLLGALEAAHGAGIVHRDIKPQNLLISAQGALKITDFGVAHVDDADHSFTKTGSLMGTIGFMSPEQQQSAKGLGPASDLYSVGASLYATLTDDDPDGLYVAQKRAKAMEELDPAFHPFFDRAMAIAAEDRFQSAAEMRAALLTVAEALPPDSENARSLDWRAPEQSTSDEDHSPTVSSEATQKAQPRTSLNTIFGLFTKGESDVPYQTEWLDDRGRKPLMIALGVLFLAGVIAAVVHTLQGG